MIFFHDTDWTLPVAILLLCTKIGISGLGLDAHKIATDHKISVYLLSSGLHVGDYACIKLLQFPLEPGYGVKLAGSTNVEVLRQYTVRSMGLRAIG
jgi:hypothetical protein